MSRHAYDISLPAFRPSVYSTGLQAVQPYTRAWPEGTMYGAWYEWLPPVMAYNYVTGKVQEGTTAAKAAAASVVDAAKATSGSVAELMKAGFSAYEARLAAAEAERIRKEEEAAAAAAAEQRATMFKVGGALVLGIGGFVLVQRYRKTGKIL